MEDYKNKSQWEFPTSDRYMVSSSLEGASESNAIFVSAESLESCKCYNRPMGCVMTISVIMNEKMPDYLDMEWFSSEMFYIEASSSISTQLQIGRPVIAELEPRQFMYFIVTIPKDEDIVFSCTSLSESSAYIYISKGDSRPTLTDFEWTSTFYRNDEVVIEKENNKFNNGTYV